jgi:hypothetical protein
VVGGCAQFDDGNGVLTEQINFEVVEFTPAPGQFVNAGYTATTMAEACEYARQRIENRYFVSLGGFGGYIVVKAEQPILNSGGYDFGIYSNAFDNSSEPGVVWVAQDRNGNGVADDEWFELYGSESKSDTILRNYSVTYLRTDDETKISWRDSEGKSGIIERNTAHLQDYFPMWISEREYTLSGVLLPDNSEWSDINQEWSLYSFDWGYADNFSAIDRSEDRANQFRISDAHTASGEAANLAYVDFIKVQSASNTIHSAIGETSTEVCGFVAYSVTK